MTIKHIKPKILWKKKKKISWENSLRKTLKEMCGERTFRKLMEKIILRKFFEKKSWTKYGERLLRKFVEKQSWENSLRRDVENMLWENNFLLSQEKERNYILHKENKALFMIIKHISPKILNANNVKKQTKKRHWDDYPAPFKYSIR